jgi:hypothetical protein
MHIWGWHGGQSGISVLREGTNGFGARLKGGIVWIQLLYRRAEVSMLRIGAA